MYNNENVLLIELTQNCNLNCKYCFYRDYGRVSNEINIKQLENILKQHKEIKEIFFTGGECTLAKDFVKIVETASEKANVSIFTNGVKLSDDNLFNKIDKYINQYIITYDEYKTDYFCRDKIIETEKTIKKILESSPEKLIVKICINKYNIKNLENIIKHLSGLGVKKISINIVHNINNSDINFELNKLEINQAFEILDKYKDICYINYYEEIKSFFVDNINKLSCKCRAGDTFCYYDCFGNKKMCPADCKKEKGCLTKECVSLFEMF